MKEYELGMETFPKNSQPLPSCLGAFDADKGCVAIILLTDVSKETESGRVIKRLKTNKKCVIIKEKARCKK